MLIVSNLTGLAIVIIMYADSHYNYACSTSTLTDAFQSYVFSVDTVVRVFTLGAVGKAVLTASAGHIVI